MKMKPIALLSNHTLLTFSGIADNNNLGRFLNPLSISKQHNMYRYNKQAQFSYFVIFVDEMG